MKQVVKKSKPTNGETVFIEKCHYFGINYVYKKTFMRDGIFYVADFFLPKYKTIVEIYDESDCAEMDRTIYNYFKSNKYEIIRINESEVDNYVFRFKVQEVYTPQQYANLKQQHNLGHINREKKRRLDFLRAKYPHS